MSEREALLPPRYRRTNQCRAITTRGERCSARAVQDDELELCKRHRAMKSRDGWVPIVAGWALKERQVEE